MKSDALAPRAGFDAPRSAAAKAWRRRLLLAAAALLVAAGGIGWLQSRNAPIDYVTVALERGDITRTTNASGTVNPVETVQVGSYVSGRIQDLFCDYNSKVTKGQLCAKIDPRSYQAAVDQAAAALATAKAQLAKDQANLDYQSLLYAHRRTLAERGAMSKESADEARSGFLQLQAQIAVDQATIDEHQAALEAARVNLDYSDIVSPVDGTVVSRSATVGQTVTASFQTPTLFLIARDLTQMQLDVNVSEADIGEIREGEKASFTVEAFPGRTFTGRVTQVRQAPVSVQNVVSYDVVIKVANPELLLKPGMTAMAHIVLGERHDVPLLPQEALRYSPPGAAPPDESAPTSGRGAVWVVRGGKLARVPLTLGLADDRNVEVTGGTLETGDRIVTGRRSQPASDDAPVE